MMKQFLDLKSKHPDALLLFRVGDFYETYQQDARKASQVLGITLTKSSKTKGPDGKPVEMAGFPYHALDTYLPKLIRAGERVAICDQLENPRATAKRNSEGSSQENKQEVKEVVAPAKKQEEEQHRGVHR
jgi:DNA mismatch repair ATPase MutS